MHRIIIQNIRHKGRALLIPVLFAMTLSFCTTPPVLEPQPEQQREPQPQQASPPVRPAIIHSDLPAIQFTIQVGAFSTTERAAAYADALLKLGLDAYYFIDGDGLCKVRFERFDTKAAAQQRAFELQTSGAIDAFYIVHPVVNDDPIDPQLSLRKNIVQTAGRFIGTPYRWGGESARGFDCSGLTMTVYRLNGLELPRNSRAQYKAGKPIQRSAIQAGDLVFFATDGKRRVSHVGVYCGKGQFIHAPGRGKRIRISAMSNGYFTRRYMGARRYF